ncbi:MAG: LysR family transcriptional regulator [Proteobacteria bacterium]|nr:MAG: LysR family transcriptional regulator [Pseudomonadota bacterium]
MNNIDWFLIHTFLAVAEHGSVSAAARAMGASQPTCSRHVRELERQTGLRLFERSAQGLALTEQGESLVEAAVAMGDSADRFSRLASGLSAELDGDLRISANEIVGYYLLPPLLARFRESHPGVRFELVITNRASSLSKREADVALRMFRPNQPDLVISRLPDLELGFFARRDYLARRGVPETFDELKAHTLIGFDEDPTFIEASARMGVDVGRDDFALRTDHMPLHIALMRAGAGIGATHVGIASAYPELVRILPQAPLPRLEFWSVCHRDLQLNPRVRALMRFIREWLGVEPYREVLG